MGFSMKSSVVKLLQPSKTYLHNIALKEAILQLKRNFRTLDIQTMQVLNDSEYLNRLEMLWEDSVEWL